MGTRYDEKGKIFTDVVPKEPVRVVMVDGLPLIGHHEHAPAGPVERRALKQPVPPGAQTALGEERRRPTAGAEPKGRGAGRRGRAPGGDGGGA